METIEVKEEKKHAILSPSGADRWMTCPGSVSLCKDLPDNENEYSREGTDYHELAAVCLDDPLDQEDAITYVGRALPKGTIVDEENAVHVMKYVNLIRSYKAMGGTLLIEEPVPIGHLTGEKDAEGTSDAVILREDPELIVADLKFGRGVEVSAIKNRQGMIYALGVIKKHQLELEYETVRIVISQPRLDIVSEWTCSMQELLEFGEEVSRAARLPMERLLNPKLPALPLVASEKACQFCKAKAFCPELKKQVERAMEMGFEDLTGTGQVVIDDKGVPVVNATGFQLGAAADMVDMVEIWMKGVRAQVESELLAGRPVIGKDGAYKLVQGKKGNREWTSETEAEALLKSFRLKQEEMYSFKLISPTATEKLLAKESPKRWKKAQDLITQKEGKLSVAAPTDPRPAHVVQKAEEGFDVITDDDASDLL